MKFLIAFFGSVLLFASTCEKTNAQALFFSTKDLARLKVRIISNLKSTPLGICNCTNLDTCAQNFKFIKGKLMEEIFYNDSSLKYSNTYAYRQGKLIGYQVDMGPSQEQHFVHYVYRNSKIFSSYQTNSRYDLNSRGDYGSDSGYDNVRKYYYDNQNRLTKIVFYESDGKKQVEAGLKYYLYQNNNLIGFFPAKDENTLTSLLPDSIYYERKLVELRKIGLNAFKAKYFSKEVYDKVIDDSYVPLSRNELLINNKPISLFLKGINKVKEKYIVFEVADNYFLFYKLID